MLVAALTIASLAALVRHGANVRAKRAIALVPETAKAVIHVDASELREGTAAQRLFAHLVPARNLSEIEAVCGMDPAEALQSVTLWIDGPEGEPLQTTGLVLRGADADAESFASCYRTLVEARGSTIEREATVEGPLLVSRDGRSAMSRVDARTVVTGSRRAVLDLLAVRGGVASSLAEQPEFAEPWTKLGRRAAVAGLFLPPARWTSAFERVGAMGEQASALEGVTAIGLTSASSAASIDVVLEVEDDATARRNATRMRVWLDSPPDSIEPPWREILRQSQIQLDHTSIAVTLDLSTLPARN